MRAHIFTMACVAFGFMVAASCSSGAKSTACATSADCLSGQICDKGLCLGSAATAAGSGSTSGAATGTGASSGSGGTNGASATTSASLVCACDTTCCSQPAAAGLICPDGSACTAAGSYCNDQSGRCDGFDPCTGDSGTWTCGQATTTSSGSSSGSGATSTSASTSSSTSSSGGTSGVASIDPTGLSFAIVGDTRPGDATSPYPTQIIQQIYQDFQGLSPQPLAVVATGDFQEANGDATLAATDIAAYESAVALFTAGPTYPTMGNHECVSTNATGTDCAGGNTTPNYLAYLQLLSDLKVPNTNGLPYYSEILTAPNGDTAKFVMTAANAWDGTQKSWFDTTLKVASTFTFVARHEPDDAQGCTNSTANDNTTNSCVYIADVQSVINANPGAVTLKLEGHTHETRFDNANDAIVSGSGGAPIETTCAGNSSNTTYCNFGYVLCQEWTDKTFHCTAYDAMTGPLATPPPRVAANGLPTGTLKYAH